MDRFKSALLSCNPILIQDDIAFYYTFTRPLLPSKERPLEEDPAKIEEPPNKYRFNFIMSPS
jgi:hypothetical protein